MKVRTLVVASSPALRTRFERLLSTASTQVSARPPDPELWGSLSGETFDLLLTTRADLPIPLAEFARSIKALPSIPNVVILTAEDDPEEQARGVADGALAVVHTRLPDASLRPMLAALSRRVRTTSEFDVVSRVELTRPELSDFVAESPSMKRLLTMAERVAQADTSVLIAGETGVGKEWLARSLHRRSGRASGPFIAVNCAALPEGLFESEVFGHVEGAFTGALHTRRGYFELAHGGTLFLDEIGELAPALQAKLLRVLQEDEVRPVGAEKAVELDARVIASTNRDLETAMEEGEFRRDLFYRVGVVTLVVPPLRARREDIPALAENYLARYSIELKRLVEAIHPRAMQALLAYPWPGNVRELINVIERAVLLSHGRELRLADLPRSVIEGSRTGEPADTNLGQEFDDAWLEQPLATVREHVGRQIEREYLVRTLARSGGRVGEAARRADISPRTLFNKMQHYGLRKEEFKY